MRKKVILGLVLLFLALQLVRPAKNLSSASGPNDAALRYPIPPAVKQLLAIACYDCHSNNTRYPWYAEVQPLGWWLASHVRDGKHAFNFSELGAYSAKTAARRLDACVDEVSDRAMPLPSYRIIHRDAHLSDAQIQLLTDWFEATRDLIKEEAAVKSASGRTASP
jgi:hypothetical protein